MIIRQIKEDDLVQCANLYSSVFSSSPWNEPWTIAIANKRLSHFYESNGFLGIIAESETINGFVLGNLEPYYFGDLFYLREMCVDSKIQKTGIGTKILAELHKQLKCKKTKGIYLLTEHAFPASKFYKKNGFQLDKNTGCYSKMFENESS